MAIDAGAMQTLSKKTRYTLRALYFLARKYGGAPVLIATLANEESIPKKFLEQILLGLGVSVVARDMGGDTGRRLTFSTVTGIVAVRIPGGADYEL